MGRVVIRIPPILRDCTFMGVEEARGKTYIVFSSPDRSVLDGVVRVQMVFDSKPLYIYTIVDRDAGVLCHYHGWVGDPAADEFDEVKGFDPA